MESSKSPLLPYVLESAEIIQVHNSDGVSLIVRQNGSEYRGRELRLDAAACKSKSEDTSSRYSALCDHMASLRHPNLVQFIGVAMNPQIAAPVLVTEKYPFSVASALDEQPKLLPDNVLLSILTDVARAMAYLHSKTPKPIVLGTALNAKTVFLTKGLQAKVDYFGTPETEQVGKKTADSAIYACPEQGSKNITAAADVYSFGVFALHVLYGKLPMSVTIDMLKPMDNTHKSSSLKHDTRLMQLVKTCLLKEPKSRPTSCDLVQKFLKLSETTSSTPFTSAIELFKRIDRRERELQVMTERLESEQQDIVKISKQIGTYEKQLSTVMEKMKRMELDLVDSLKPENPEKQKATQKRILLPPIDTNKTADDVMNDKDQQGYLKPTQSGFTWKIQSSRAPVGMYGANAVVLEGKIYIGGGKGKSFQTDCTLYEYDINGLVQKWTPVPVCPVAYYALSIINRSIVLVGGMDRSTGQASNQLWMWDKVEQTWKVSLPNMPTARLHPSAFMHDFRLIVAGGCRNDIPCAQVEMFDQATFQWHSLPNLPVPCAGASSCVVDSTLYLIGGMVYKDTGPSTTVQALSLSVNSPSDVTWRSCKDAPLTLSCGIPAENFILAVGGSYPGTIVPTGSIYVYFPSLDQWSYLCEMPIARSHCTVCLLSAGKLFIFGGKEEGKHHTEFGDTTELLLV